MAKVTIPKPVLNRTARRRLIDRNARAVISGNGVSEAIEDFVLRTYYGRKGRGLLEANSQPDMQWSGPQDANGVRRRAFYDVEEKLHNEVGRALALSAGKQLNKRLTRNGKTLVGVV